MSAQLLTVVTAYLGLVGVLALLAAVGMRCGTAVRAGIVVAQVLLVAQVAVDLTSWLRGHRPSDWATHMGYAVVSVALLPLLTSRAEKPASRTDHVLTAIAVVAAIVVSVRLHQTWAT